MFISNLSEGMHPYEGFGSINTPPLSMADDYQSLADGINDIVGAPISACLGLASRPLRTI